MKKTLNIILTVCLTVGIAFPHISEELIVRATTISQLQQQINKTQGHLSEINHRLEDLADQQDVLEEQIADLNAEILNTMTSISMKEDEIAAKEVELADKQKEIGAAQAEYEAARAKEEEQHTAMVKRVRRMYEKGTDTVLELFLQSEGLSGMLNRMDFVETIYEYDRLQLAQYQEIRELVQALKEQLETEKIQLQREKEQLEAARVALETQKADLDVMLAQKRRESKNFEAEIEKARQEAAVAKALLQQEQRKLAQLQAQQSGSGNAANGNYTSDYNSVISNAAGSDLGKKIANYACQYIGNPYVYGGTSLTNGADCSGFTYRVYMDFGYKLPRTSGEQQSAGAGVDYANAQPGDLICYSGHVGIYIGGGKIVHASTERTGIKVSNAAYRPIVTVRRII